MIKTLKKIGQFTAMIIVDVLQIAGCALELVIRLLWRGLILGRTGLRKLIEILRLDDWTLVNCYTDPLFASTSKSKSDEKAE